MPSNRKYFPHNSVIFCTSRVEEGLPIVCSHNLNFIIWGILAKASELYSTEVNHFVFLGNHFHFIIRVVDTDDVQAFVRYVKGEIAHAINRLLGRRQRTIWKDGYDSPIVLDPDKLRNLVTYLYLNPARANLVDSINEYPGVSSWEMFKSGRNTKICKKISRAKITKLYSPSIPVSEQKDLVKRYELDAKKHEFKIEPLGCFRALDEHNDIRQELIGEIYKEEAKLRNEKKFEPIGSTELRRQSMLKEHTPKKFSPKMICLSIEKSLRQVFIENYRYLCALASKAYQHWKQGDFNHKMPASMYSPRPPPLLVELSL